MARGQHPKPGFILYTEDGITVSPINPLPVVIGNSSGDGTSFGTAILTSSTTVLVDNPARISAIIVNDSNSTVYLDYGTAPALHKGIRLNRYGGSVTEDIYTGIITAVSDADGKTVTVTEL
jgi:hypothetical protein